MSSAIDSNCWKRHLLLIARKLESRRKQQRWSNWSGDMLFLEINTACFYMRKLIEANKLTHKVASSRISCDVFPNIKHVHFLNLESFERLYDWSARRSRTLELLEFVNQVIHSYVWSNLLQQNGRIWGILICSDRMRQREIYGVKLSEIVMAIKKVAFDEIRSMRMVRDDRSGEYHITEAK